MLRREKKFVLTDLVPKKEMIIYCPLTEMQNYLYKACLQKDMVKLTMEGPSDKVCNKNKIYSILLKIGKRRLQRKSVQETAEKQLITLLLIINTNTHSYQNTIRK